jgi:predicted RNA-binding protein with PUA-like domain
MRTDQKQHSTSQCLLVDGEAGWGGVRAHEGVGLMHMFSFGDDGFMDTHTCQNLSNYTLYPFI